MLRRAVSRLFVNVCKGICTCVWLHLLLGDQYRATGVRTSPRGCRRRPRGVWPVAGNGGSGNLNPGDGVAWRGYAREGD